MADEIREHLATTQKGQTANTIGNCMIVFRADSMLRGVIRLNLLTERVDIVRDLGWRRMTAALTDTDMKYLRLYFEENYGITSSPKIEDALAIIANETATTPFRTAWLPLSGIKSHGFGAACTISWVQSRAIMWRPA